MTDLTDADLDRLADRLGTLEQRRTHERLAALMAPPRPRPSVPEPAPPDEVAAEVRYDPDRVCATCGVRGLMVELYDPVPGTQEVPEAGVPTGAYACDACDHLPHYEGSDSPDWHRLLGLAWVTPLKGVLDAPAPDDLRALGCRTFAEADLTEANPRPLTHVPWDEVRAECYRRWPDERFWRSPTRRAEARELAGRGGHR